MATLANVLTRPILAIGTPLSLILVLATLPLVLPILLPLIFLVLLVILIAVLMALMLVLLALLVLLVRHTPQLLYSPKFSAAEETSNQAPVQAQAQRKPESIRPSSANGSIRVPRVEGFNRRRLGSCHEPGFQLDQDDDTASNFTTGKQATSSPSFGIDSPRKR